MNKNIVKDFYNDITTLHQSDSFQTAEARYQGIIKKLDGIYLQDEITLSECSELEELARAELYQFQRDMENRGS